MVLQMHQSWWDAQKGKKEKKKENKNSTRHDTTTKTICLNEH